MAPSKKSKAPAKKAAVKKTVKAPAKKVAAKPAPKAAVKPAAKPAAKQAAKATPSVAVYNQAPKAAAPAPQSAPRKSAKAQAATTLAFAGKVWWAFAWRQYALGFIMNALFSIAAIIIVMVVGSIRFQVWALTLQMEYPGIIEAFNFVTGILLGFVATWLGVYWAIRRGAKRGYKTFSIAHHKPNGTPAVGLRAQLPLAFGLWWRQTLMSVVFMSAAVMVFSYTTEGGEFLTAPEKAYIALVIVFFVLANIAIIDRLITKRHFKFFSLVVEPRTDKQA